MRTYEPMLFAVSGITLEWSQIIIALLTGVFSAGGIAALINARQSAKKTPVEVEAVEIANADKIAAMAYMAADRAAAEAQRAHDRADTQDGRLTAMQKNYEEERAAREQLGRELLEVASWWWQRIVPNWSTIRESTEPPEGPDPITRRQQIKET